MPIQHLSRDSSSDSIAKALERDGCVVLDNVLDRAEIDQVARDMAPYMEAAPKGKDEFDGFETRRAPWGLGGSTPPLSATAYPSLGVVRTAMSRVANSRPGEIPRGFDSLTFSHCPVV